MTIDALINRLRPFAPQLAAALMAVLAAIVIAIGLADPAGSSRKAQPAPPPAAATQTPPRTGPFTINDWRAPAPKRLDLPTHDGSGQATHPSVVHIPGGWNGFTYWMAMTPYPHSRDAEEDPNILASNDGDTWQTPPGLSNPIDDAPGSPESFNSDTNLVFDNNQLILTWRRVTPNKKVEFFLSTSTDGVHWTPKTVIATSNVLSQALVKVDGTWRLYAIRPTGEENTLVYWESTEPIPTGKGWGPRKEAQLPSFAPSFEPWHVDIQLVDGEFIGLLTTTEFNKNGVRGFTFLMRSPDGIAWEVADHPLWPVTGRTYDAHYKSGFVAHGSKDTLLLDVYASTLNTSTREWHIGRTTATAR